uniref:Sodium channel and clathrin linker 1 n=1 Tax=Astyanax mexicanus TaxID=7994 RepID=W5K703_ASTMX
TEDVGSESAAPWLADRIMAPLIAEYDRHMQQMEAQLKLYQRQMADVKASLEQVVRENELHAEQRVSVERQLQSLSVGVDGDAAADAATVNNLEEQVKCAVELQEKERALQMWQAAAQELDRLQKLYQSTMRDGQLHTAERQHIQNQLAQVQQHTQKLQTTNQSLESTNQQFLKTIAEQSSELEELRNQLQAKQELRTATAKVDEMTRLMQNVQDQMQRTEEDAAEAHGREEASDRRLQQLQAALSQLEGLKGATAEAESVRREQAVWERKLGELQSRCATLEEEKFETFQRLRNSLQLAEEASLQRDQAQLRENQRVEELERMKEGMKQLVEEAAARTRREVEAVRKQYNSQIHRLAEELSALQLVYREGRCGEPELRKMEALHQRCLNAERQKEETELTLNTTQSNMKKLEMEELSRCQEEVRRLQVALASAREESSSISEERLSLQQENQQLHRDMDTLRKECVLAQRQAKQQVSCMQQELSVKEQSLEARLREMEESSKSSNAGLSRLLQAQQKTTNRYREEAKQLTHTFQNTVSSLSELNRQKQRCEELEIQLETDHKKILEFERQLVEHQEKNARLQTRLSQAEHRASSASQQFQLSVIQRRKAASMMDLDTLS